NCAVDCGPVGHRNGGISYRARAALDSPTARVFDRNAGGNSECHSRALGHFRNDSVAARLSLRMAQTVLRLDTLVQWIDLRSVHACRRDYYRGYDFADNRFGLARDFAQCPGLAKRGRLRSRSDSLGGNAHCSAELRKERV